MRALHPYRWPLTVVASVAIAAWAALEIAVVALQLDPSTVESLIAVRSWAMRIGAAATALLMPVVVAALDRNGDGQVDARDFVDPPDPPLGGAGAAAALLVLTAIVVSCSLAVGCGGPPREAYVAVSETAGGVDTVDQALVEPTRVAGEEVRAEVRDRARAGAFEDACGALELEARRACVVEHGLALFDELLAAHWTTDARLGNALAAKALHALERALDAWAVGTADAGAFAETAACVVSALRYVADALVRGGLELPDALTGALQLVAGIAERTCPDPELATPGGVS